MFKSAKLRILLSGFSIFMCSTYIHAKELAVAQEYIDLNHGLEHDLVTYPGLSEVKVFQKGERFSNGALIDGISFLGISGTYIDAPFHVDEKGAKISDYSLEQLANLPIVVVQLPLNAKKFDVAAFKNVDVKGKAVLLYTGRDKYFGTKEYSHNPPFLTASAAEWLVSQKVKFVGIDALLVDDFNNNSTVPVHNTLLKNGVVIAEDMAHIDKVMGKKDAYLTAVPPRAPLTSFPTRIFATIY